MSKISHREIMEEDGFTVVDKPSKPKPYHDGDVATTSAESDYDAITEERVLKSMGKAKKCLDEHLDKYVELFIQQIRDAVGVNGHLKTIRAIGIGSFGQNHSDSSLQMVMLERIRSQYGNPPTFYQEPRSSKGERGYLQCRNIDFLLPDELNCIPTPIQHLMTEHPNERHLVFMIHFDHYGFERILRSYDKLDAQRSLIFVGNTVPIDYTGELNNWLPTMNCNSVSVPEHDNGLCSERCSNWWKKAFSNTNVYSHK